jgi:hypothetical protein
MRTCILHARDKGGRMIDTDRLTGKTNYLHLREDQGITAASDVERQARIAEVQRRMEKEAAAAATEREVQRLEDERRQAAARRSDALRLQSRDAYQRRVDQFQAIVAGLGAQQIAGELNAIVDTVWKVHAPVLASGKNKGAPRPQPLFAVLANGQWVLFRNLDRTSHIRIQTPVAGISAGAEVDHYWRFSGMAWNQPAPTRAVKPTWRASWRAALATGTAAGANRSARG